MKRLVVLLENEKHAQLKMLAVKKNIPMTDIVGKLVDKLLEKQKPTKQQ